MSYSPESCEVWERALKRRGLGRQAPEIIEATTEYFPKLPNWLEVLHSKLFERFVRNYGARPTNPNGIVTPLEMSLLACGLTETEAELILLDRLRRIKNALPIGVHTANLVLGASGGGSLKVGFSGVQYCPKPDPVYLPRRTPKRLLTPGVNYTIDEWIALANREMYGDMLWSEPTSIPAILDKLSPDEPRS